MLYLLFAILIFQFIKQTRYLKSVLKHDRILYMFCQLRRDTIAHLTSAELSEKDTQALLSVLDRTSGSIHHYNQLKITYFNLNFLRKEIRTLKRNIDVEENIVFSDNGDIKKLEETLYKTYIHAFMAYSPVFSMLANLLFVLMKLLVKLSAHFLKRYVTELQWFLTVRQEQATEQV